MNGTGSAGGASRALADWVVGTDALPAEVRTRGEEMLLDALGAMLGGAQGPTPRKVRQTLCQTMPGDEAVLGTDMRAARPAAIFANGVAIHALELDDGYTRGSVHPSAPVLPAALAAALERDMTIGDLVDSLVLGAEITCRIAEAGHPETYRRGFHNTPLAGCPGAAAAAGRLLGLDARQMLSAIAIACSQSSGLFEFLEDGTDVKKLHPGMAAKSGWLSAQFARNGLTGPATVLEGKRGYFAAFTGDGSNAALALEDLGSSWRVLQMYVKPHACCRALHATVDVLLDLRREHRLDWDEVRSVQVETYGKAAEYDNREISSLMDAQMSLPLAAVLALRHGKVTVETLEAAAQGAVPAEDLHRIQVNHRVEFDAMYPPLRPVQVKVQTGGASFEGFSDRPTGEPGRELSREDLRAKFLSLSEPVLGESRAAAVAALTGNRAASVKELVAACIP